jgi:alpha,alpha-trehalase
VLLCTAWLGCASAPATGSERAVLPAAGRAQVCTPPVALERIRAYIRTGWRQLTRDHRGLLAAAIDPKFPGSDDAWPLYISAREDESAVRERLRRAMPAADFARIEILRLPEDPGTIRRHGLLYLPYPYVVPGGRFNEMYGWDSYFILLGLLRDGELALARHMVDNFLYEVEHYGVVLNANRSYYLSRSQPPFLAAMVLAVYGKSGDRQWLARALPAVVSYHAHFTRPPHLTPETGLSRYHDHGSGPAPEVLSSEKDAQGRTHYDRVAAYYRTHEVEDYDLRRFYDRTSDTLTPLFYVADRSMRESGFDPSNRFGPFNIGIIDHDPVCLNSLLYLMEQQIGQIEAILGRPGEAAAWRARAARRARAVNELLWDERAGLYLDYDVTRRQRRDYPFATTFFPLWVGLATPAQARRVVSQLPRFERPGGIVTSERVSGNQWDAPFGWAPLQLAAVRGLERYGYHTEAQRIAGKFVSLVLKEFHEHNGIFEKYDVERRSSSTAADVRFGYSSNEIGFGWTNAVFLELLASLRDVPPARLGCEP